MFWSLKLVINVEEEILYKMKKKTLKGMRQETVFYSINQLAHVVNIRTKENKRCKVLF